MKRDAALLIIDVQNDFCSNGSLAVPGGDRVVEPLSHIARLFATSGLPVLASRDWHPPVTSHFKEFGGAWPPHCVQESYGAAFHPDLQLPEGTFIISKGTDPDSDSYSAFDGQTGDGCPLRELLTRLHVRRIYIGGLATDYCVCSSVLAARKGGFQVTVLDDAIAGVDLVASDSERAKRNMLDAGACFSTTEEAILQLGLLNPAEHGEH